MNMNKLIDSLEAIEPGLAFTVYRAMCRCQDCTCGREESTPQQMLEDLLYKYQAFNKANEGFLNGLVNHADMAGFLKDSTDYQESVVNDSIAPIELKPIKFCQRSVA